MARNFNGTTDWLQVDAARINGTVMFKWDSPATWSFFANGGGVSQCVYCEFQGGTSNNLFALSCDSATGAHLNVVMHDNVGNVTLNVTGTLTAFGDGNPHHVAWVQTPNAGATTVVCQSFVDGVLDINTSFNPNPTFDLQPLGARIGELGDPKTHFFSGDIWRVATGNIALSSSQVASLASGLPASHYVPLHYWPLWGDSPEADVGRGWTINDGPVPGPRTPAAVVGTTYTSEREVGVGLLPFQGHSG